MPVDAEPLLWVEMKARARERGIPLRALLSERSRSKIRRGIECREDTYDKLDDMLEWEPGSAIDAATKGVPPRAKQRGIHRAAERQARKYELIGNVNRYATMLADSPDDVPDDVLADAERKLRELAERLSRGGTSTNGQQRRR